MQITQVTQVTQMKEVGQEDVPWQFSDKGNYLIDFGVDLR